jgi:hypothetical protein
MWIDAEVSRFKNYRALAQPGRSCHPVVCREQADIRESVESRPPRLFPRKVIDRWRRRREAVPPDDEVKDDAAWQYTTEWGKVTTVSEVGCTPKPADYRSVDGYTLRRMGGST